MKIINPEKIRLRKNIPKMYLVSFFLSLDFVGGVLIPFFSVWGGLNMFKIMILQAWFMLWTAILEIPTGAIADYFGRKQSISLGLFVRALTVVIYIIKPNFYFFLFAEFLFALSAALISGADKAIIYESLNKTGQIGKTTKVFTNARTIRLLGYMISAPIGSLIGSKLGLQYPMLLMSIPYLISGIISLTIEEPKGEKPSESKRYFQTLFVGVNFFKNHKILKILAFDFAIITTFGYFIIWLSQKKMQSLGLPIIYFGVIQATMVLFEIIMTNIYPKLHKILGNQKRVLFLGGLIPGILYIVAAFNSSVFIAVLWIFLGAGLTLSREAVFLSCFNKHIQDDKMRATVLSSISMLDQIILVIISPIIGFTTDLSLGYTMFGLGIACIAFSIFSKVKEEHLVN